jgi:hypothetical protein
VTRTFSFAALLIVAAIAVAGVAVVSCQRTGGSTAIIATKAAFRPDKLGFERCSLEVAGSKFTADVRQSIKGSEVRIDLLAHDTIFETERYLSTDESFSVIDAGGEQFEKAIPLVKYPMHVGDTWEWTGGVLTGPASHKASAKISTSSEDLPVKNLHNVIRIQVDLSYETGAQGVASIRKLIFWIAPNMGVVKRAFGDYSKREPLEE